MVENNLSKIAISVVIPAHNSATHIRETLESVLAQTYPPLEVIVVDDGSTDETVAIVQSYSGMVKLLQQEHRGVSAARNLGIQRAKGEYIAFVDSDDLWLPEKLEHQVVCLIEKKVAWVCCEADFFDDKSGRILYNYRKKLYEGDVLEREFLNTFIRSPTPIVKKSVFEEVGYFDEDEDARIGEDKEMWMRIAARYPLGAVHQILALKREHSASTMSRVSADEIFQIQLIVIDKIVARQPERLEPLKNQVLSKLYLNRGATLLKQGEYEQAIPLVDQAWNLNPCNIKAGAYWLVLHSGKIGRRGYRIFRKSKNLSS